MTEWQEFRNPDFEVMRRLLKEPVIFDGRNLYDAEDDGAVRVHLLRRSAAAGTGRPADGGPGRWPVRPKRERAGACRPGPLAFR